MSAYVHVYVDANIHMYVLHRGGLWQFICDVHALSILHQ